LLVASDVSAVIVTRGDVDLDPILATLPFSDVVIWNDMERGSKGCYGRWLAMEECENDVIFLQDDDLIFTAHEELLNVYEPDRITTNMPSPWYENTGYAEMRVGLVGAGSLVPRGLHEPAVEHYLAHFPEDRLFLDYCDFIIGALTPYERFDFGYEILPCASAPNRIWTQPDAGWKKLEVIRRSMALRALAVR
jgi:hypothetical protein